MVASDKLLSVVLWLASPETAHKVALTGISPRSLFQVKDRGVRAITLLNRSTKSIYRVSVGYPRIKTNGTAVKSLCVAITQPKSDTKSGREVYRFLPLNLIGVKPLLGKVK